MSNLQTIDMDTISLIDRLEKHADAVTEAIKYIEAVRGPEHFAASVEALLVGTVWEKPLKHDIEGLYGRVRGAIQCAKEGQREAEDYS